MLLPDNIHPENSIYYNGSIVLESLRATTSVSPFDLYERVKQERNMTFSIFVLCLDWLYLIGVAQLNNDGKIELCS